MSKGSSVVGAKKKVLWFFVIFVIAGGLIAIAALLRSIDVLGFLKKLHGGI